MIAPACKHENKKKHGRDRKGNQRYRCLDCGATWSERPANPLGTMQIDMDKAKIALHMLAEGNSIRSVERMTRLHRDTICRLLVHFGTACQKFMDEQMRGLNLTHLQFDEQWTFVFKKQARLTIEEREKCHDIGDIYLWTCIDEKTKLLPSFRIGKRSADNARRFMMDVAGRLTFPKPHASDAHAYDLGGYRPVVQISTDGFAA